MGGVTCVIAILGEPSLKDICQRHGLLVADRLETEIKMSAVTFGYLKLKEKAMWRKDEMACTMLRLPIALVLSTQTSNIHELQN